MTALPEPRKVPNIEFVISIEDALSNDPSLDRIVWGYNRASDDYNTWVMPDFDGWSYPDDDLGGYDAFRTRAKKFEKPFMEKIPQVVWRGSGSVGDEIREPMVQMLKDKPWADVDFTGWKTHKNVMPMHELCNYQYPVHTEGRQAKSHLQFWG